MQDIHGIGGGGARLFTAGGGGGGGGGDRRLRPHNHQNHQPLKCPRCDSLNTKFCYYNNYNLSQPRHFCKSCRRYWTKGGVLRNVPVGGGCRKSKRSKLKSSASTSTTADTVQHEQKSNSHSSSESSSVTATATTATANTTTGATAEVASATNSNLLNFADASSFFPSKHATNPSFDHQPLIDDHTSNGQMFPEVGSFTDIMTSVNEPEILAFNNNSAYRLQQDDYPPVADDHSSKIVGTTSDNELKMKETNTTGYPDQTVQIDWQNHRAAEQGIFDFTGAVDQAYWSQTQWPDTDQSLNFFP